MKYCGRQFKEAEIEVIRAMIAADPRLSRYRISTKVCEHLNWRRPDGGLKDMSCRVALLRMQADGLFSLPAARRAKPATYVANPEIERVVDRPLIVSEVDLDRLTVDLVVEKRAPSAFFPGRCTLHDRLTALGLAAETVNPAGALLDGARVPGEIVMNDVTAESLEVHSLPHYLAADEDVRKKWSVEGTHKARPCLAPRDSGGNLNVGKRDGRILRFVFLPIFHPNAARLRAPSGFKVRRALLCGAFDEELDESVELLPPRCS